MLFRVDAFSLPVRQDQINASRAVRPKTGRALDQIR